MLRAEVLEAFKIGYNKTTIKRKTMKKKLFLLLVLSIGWQTVVRAQGQSFLILGDIHYDRLENHDMDWLSKKPDDLRQVTKEYTQFTKNNWSGFISLLRQTVKEYKPEIKAVVQVGDLSEGLAGSEEKARQMACSIVKVVNETRLSVPWIIAKGNHDITGPGAKDAFKQYYIPMFCKQLNRSDIVSANYAHMIGDNLFVCIDPWERNFDILGFLEKALGSSEAKYKFVVIHEPVIPVNERCWHVYRDNPKQRDKLLKILACNRAIVLAAHLHLFSIVKRETEYGPIVQLMCNSVIKDPKNQNSRKVFTRFGSSLAKDCPDWQPSTMSERVKWLDEETPYISYFKQQDLAGYGILTTDAEKEEIFFEYYTPGSKKPYERICVSDLLK